MSDEKEIIEEKIEDNVAGGELIQGGEITQAETVSEAAEEEFSSDSYKIKLDDFEGPLDLLLHLIKKSKINIEDIFISQITEQYLGYMNQIKDIDLDKASEFIEIAAQLLEIKSKSLLPKPVTAVDPEAEDDEKRFIQRLEEYNLFKQASEKMKRQETVDMHYRDPDDTVGTTKFVLKDMNMQGLIKALQKMFLKLDEKELKSLQRKITLDRFTVSEKMDHIRDAMVLRDNVSFFELFESDYTKSEIITTFQALLELMKLQFLSAEQNEIYGDIILHKVA